MYVKQNVPCLEHCLKKLSKGLESFMVSIVGGQYSWPKYVVILNGRHLGDMVYVHELHSHS